MDEAQKEVGFDKKNLQVPQITMAKQCRSTYWEIFAFSPHVDLKHQVKDMECFSLTAGLVEGKDGTNLKPGSRRKVCSNFAGEPLSHLHEKLWAFGHEQLYDEGRREARDGAEDHKQPPALEVHKAQREMGPGFWNDKPGQTCQQRHSLHQRPCSAAF